MDTRAAKRYAQALMDIGTEMGSLERIAQDMRMIEVTLHESRELRSVLKSPVLRHEKKYKILHQIFGEHVSKEVMSFMDLLVRKGRSEVLAGTVTEFRELLDIVSGIQSATVTSAVALTTNEQQIIHEKLQKITGKTVRALFTIDPTVRGGFTARIGDTMIDASLRHQLELLREQFRTGGAAMN